MKKFLSLVLVLVMAMSMVTISAGAATFSDSDTIDPNYLEGTELLHALNIHPGFPEGFYAPQNQMSRGFACKTFVELLIGVEAGLKLPYGKSYFKDVTADYRYAPYVNYMAERGWINGYEDGKFLPKELISADGMLKMALAVLGYKGDYTGANWQLRVRADAKAAGLMDDIAAFRADSADREQLEWWAIQRDECAQVLKNTLLANVVDTNGKPVAGTAGAHYEITAGVAGDSVLQLVEKCWPDLKKDAGAVDFLDREGTAWILKDAQIVFVQD